MGLMLAGIQWPRVQWPWRSWLPLVVPLEKAIGVPLPRSGQSALPTARTLASAIAYPENQALVAFVDAAAGEIMKKGEAVFPEFRKKNGRWFRGDRYVFVMDLEGNRYVYPPDPANERSISLPTGIWAASRSAGCWWIGLARGMVVAGCTTSGIVPSLNIAVRYGNPPTWCVYRPLRGKPTWWAVESMKARWRKASWWMR